VKIPATSEPLLPLYSFLFGEVYRRRVDPIHAVQWYRTLVEWAATDPYKDQQGASGLVAVAIWRWLQMSSTQASPPLTTSQFQQIITVWDQHARLLEGMFENSTGAFTALPQLKEDIVRRLSALAWRLGKKDDARRFFLDYLAVATTTQFNESETLLLDEAVATQALSRAKVQLTLGKRLFALGKYDEAKEILQKVEQSNDPTATAEARLLLANVLNSTAGTRCLTPEFTDLIEKIVAEAKDPDVVQDALLLRARKHVREGCTINVEAFATDLQRVITIVPQGRKAAQALYELAAYQMESYLDTGKAVELEKAVQLFAQLRESPQRDLFLDSAYFQPAIGYYLRGEPGDLQKATHFLRQLENERPDGPFHLKAQFWLARIAAELGETSESRQRFAAIIRESPYDYYAIRARMHLRIGVRARKELSLNAKTKWDLRRSFDQSVRANSTPVGVSPYQVRLHAALSAGIYQDVLQKEVELRRDKVGSRRIEQVSLDDLDTWQAVTTVGLLLALRQDALAAADLPPVVNRLQTAHLVCHWRDHDLASCDAPLLVFLIGAVNSSSAVQGELQRDLRYLAITYPKVFASTIMHVTNSFNVPPELLYAVMRAESAFYPAAVSPMAAVGLFQFTLPTFRVLNQRWQLGIELRDETLRQYLFEPEHSIALGARWFSEELLRPQEGNIFWALIVHNAGGSVVTAWKRRWERAKRIDDYEYMLETIRFRETRNFVRRVLTTFWIVGAAGMYQ